MEVFINIDGVLRNIIQKFDYHYEDYYLNTETESEETFEYKVLDNTSNKNLMEAYSFQSKEEFLKFLYMDFPVEIFGHAGLSYNQASTEFNSLVFNHEKINFTLIGLNEKGKAKPATLFFLSRNGVMCNNIKFSSIENIKKLWKKCDLWISDDENVINSCPIGKKSVKFNTPYNKHFTNKLEINKLSEINEKWLNYSGNNIISTLKQLVQNVKQVILSKTTGVQTPQR